MSDSSSRRVAIKKIVAGTAAMGATGMLSSLRATAESTSNKKKKKLKLKGAVHHSVCRWCYGDIPLDQLCEAVKKKFFTLRYGSRCSLARVLARPCYILAAWKYIDKFPKEAIQA